MTPFSLQRRLLAALLPLMLLALLLASLIMYFSVRNKVEDLFDAQLTHTAKILTNLVNHEFVEHGFVDRSLVALDDIEYIYHSFNTSYNESMIFQVRSLEGVLLLRTEGSPEYPLSPTASGFSHALIQGKSWKVYSISTKKNGFTVQVAMKYAFLDQIQASIALQSLLPILAIMPILAMAIIYGVRSATIPLLHLSQDIRQRSANDLSPIPTDKLPEEIVPLISGFNTLLDRVNASIENERRFTDDAAHELRTPLAGIKLQAQLILKQSDDQARKEALSYLIQAVDRTTHLVHQLLVLARLGPEQATAATTTVSLRDIAATTLADHYILANKKNITLKLEDGTSGVIRANPHLLTILLNNILGNALQYTPDHGEIDVNVDESPQAVTISVSDSGPGIPQHERDKVMRRFYRIPGSEGSGCGLGLSIVSRIVDLYHGNVALDQSSLGGLKVTITLPLS